MGGTGFQPREYRVLTWLVWVLCLCACRQETAAQGASPLLNASAIAYDAAGNLYIADAKAHRVFQATLAGSLQVVAGSGTQGFAGDGGTATSAQLNQPQGLAIGPGGTLYIADTGNHSIRAVNAKGVITTFAGTGLASFSGDGGPALNAALRSPTAIALDTTGALLLCDTGNHRLRRVSAGVITTLAGSGNQGFTGDGGPAISASLDSPAGVALDSKGRIYLADTHNNRVRVIETSGLIGAFAGNGAAGFAGDGGSAVDAALSAPRGLVVNPDGLVLVADTGNERVRQITSVGIISTLVGTGIEGASVDAAASQAASMHGPRSVAVSSFGFPVVADTANNTVLEISGKQLYRPAGLMTGRASAVQTAPSLTGIYGQSLVSANVKGPVQTPQGYLQASADGQAQASATLAAGSARLDLSALNVGTHQVTLAYSGDGLNPAATTSLAATVMPATLLASANAATVEYGAPLPQLSGVLAGVLPADTAQLSASYGIVSSDLPTVGSYPILATLAGPKAVNYTVTMANGSGQLTVTKASSSASLGYPSQAFVGVPLQLTANIAASKRGQPTGTVQFLDGSAVIATQALSGGAATTVYSPPPGGSHSLSVQYLGDANFYPSASVPATISLATLPDFAVAPTGSQTATTTAGNTATYTLTVSSQSGRFTGAVSLSLTGLPSGATVQFSPPQVVPDVGSATVTALVQTPAATTNSAHNLGGRSGGDELAFAVLGFSGIGLLRRRRRLGIATCALSLVFALSGCGARTVGEGIGGVIANTYNLQVTGTATNLAGAVVSHSMPLTLTVQQ